MTSDIDDDEFGWPEEQAERVKLFVSDEYYSSQEKTRSERRMCVLRFDKKRRLLKVVSADDKEEITLDSINPKDIIGVNVEIKLIDQQPVASCNTVKSDVLSQIDEQILFSREKIVSPADNEPIPEDPIDSQARAVLSLFVYPKQKTSTTKSILRFCGAERTKTGEVCCDGIDRYRDNSDPVESNAFGHRYGLHRRFTVVPLEDFTDLSIMVNAIRNLFRPEEIKRDEERILVIVNPSSGNKIGVHIYDTTLRPMLEQAGIAYDCLITTHTRHAEERMKKQNAASDFRDITEYTGIVLVGGDGIIHEVMQGVHRRSDRDEILTSVKFGAIGAGTSNGFSATLAFASKEKHSPLDCAFMIVKGMSSLVDLSRYETKSTSYTSFLTFSWAMIADIDIESECIRWAGFLRMDIWGVVRLLFLRKYRAKFSYLLPTGEKSLECLPPLSQPIPDSKKWVTCVDDFILFWASLASHAGEQMFHAPPCKINDGAFHIMIVRGNVSRLRLALILLSMEHGGHVGMTGVEFIKCSAYRLEPITKGSYNDLDGEVIEAGAIQGAISLPPLQAYCNPEPDSENDQ